MYTAKLSSLGWALDYTVCEVGRSCTSIYCDIHIGYFIWLWYTTLGTCRYFSAYADSAFYPPRNGKISASNNKIICDGGRGLEAHVIWPGWGCLHTEMFEYESGHPCAGYSKHEFAWF